MNQHTAATHDEGTLSTGWRVLSHVMWMLVGSALTLVILVVTLMVVPLSSLCEDASTSCPAAQTVKEFRHGLVHDE